MGKMITINNLIKKYNFFELNIPSLCFEQKKIYSIVGQNGAGKTTLIKCIMGLLDYQGDIEIFGRKISNNREAILQDISYIGDRINYNNELTVKQIIQFFNHYYENWDNNSLLQMFELFKLDQFWNNKIQSLSRGTGVKLSVAIGLSHKPKILILDEPTSGLDPVVRTTVLKVIKQFSNQNDAIVIFSSHIIEDIETISDELIVINNGNLLLHETLISSMEFSKKFNGLKNYILHLIEKDDQNV